MPTINRPRKKRTFEDTEARKKRKKVYDTARWRKLRAWKLALTPICELCEKEGETVPAEDVHHIVSFTGAESPEKINELAFDIKNLMSLCKRHHQQIHNGKKKNKAGQIARLKTTKKKMNF